ncbi:MAG: urea carboxylase-associated family protein, partial [Proteobacteria bacterium]|nr:urea carboxylase-associated family protein [Pseudomonadota bacterium]
MTQDSELHTIPARRGRAARLSQGQSIKIINTHGQQVVDTWAFSAEDLTEFMSMEHIRPTLTRIFPRAGDDLVTNRRRPILHFAEDTSPGVHDTLMAACDDYRYGLLGCTEYHDNCTDNLFAALRNIGLSAPECPSPLNMWMNIPVDGEGNTEWGVPASKPGDYVVLRAEMD